MGNTGKMFTGYKCGIVDQKAEAEFAQLVKDCLESDVPRHVLADHFEVSESTISRWERGKSIPMKIIRDEVEKVLLQFKAGQWLQEDGQIAQIARLKKENP